MKNTKFPQIFIEYYIGIDISKDTIHCYLKPANDSKEYCKENQRIVDNNPKAIKRYIVSVLKDKKIVAVVMENTGGYELYAAETFTEAGYSVSVVDPGRARSLMNGMGINAKTDKVDAFALALIAQRLWGDEDILSVYVPMPQSLKGLQNSVDRYCNLTRSIARCKNRLKKPHNKDNKAIVKSLKRELKWLQKERDAFLQDIRAQIANDPQMAKWDEILQSVPGIATIISATLIAFLPELGKLNREKIASLAGLAPHPCDSGTKHGSRHAKKGRQRIKSVWMPAIACSIQHNPALQAFYQRLTARGKEKKLL
ncbi:MAG: IS110 family transposase [Thermoguttaceae bacterium]|nr:IS110 family transposase [Thermoguttaceae bacterium]